MGPNSRQRLRLRLLCIGLPMFAVLIPSIGHASTWVPHLDAGSSGHAHSATLPVANAPVASCPAPTTSKTIKVSWTAVTHATSYSVYQSTTSATAGYTLAISGLTTTSWTSGTLAAATHWFEIVVVSGTKWTSANSTATSQATIHSTGTLCTMP